MNMPQVRVERRVGQRFSYLLPVSLRQNATSTEGLGFTQDLSSRGVFFFTDAALQVGAEIELTLRLPSEITLGESMPVRCHGHVLRIVRPDQGSPAHNAAETKIGVAVRFDGYEYLSDAPELQSDFTRVSALHSHHEDEPVVPQTSARTVVG